ncbi:PEP-CTERM sorting domain-containing protein [Aurantiacibacter zhengii]|uniref:PEP-CTERM sorting domain-containing protein n=1 Tax=Aurantiacibacter zhengii TaxID=2307003 RepID=A0A418NRZ3_9SPHN|nr:PEP-CTERM sorting domain-containing protein [Aurantiacibacter zhengii]RIV85712.1 PEP-CTERM sorting domain-containing protein [Aurantiacibacter zhengii]
MWSRLTIAAALFASAAPAAAEGATQVPEASGLTLFAIGVAGVLIGRRLSMRSKDQD